ncbi:MAG: dihydroorotate dehydrogenase [Endomicrobiia bacterium]
MLSHLSTSIGNLKLNNPIIIASGVCGFGEENVEVLNQCGAVVFKTITLNPRKGNPTPRVVDFSYGMLNSIGLENPGVDGIKDKIEYIKKLRCKKIASFLAETKDEFFIILEKLENYKIFDGYEINLSCPNVEKGKWFYDTKILQGILKDLRQKTKKPLIAKLSSEMNLLENVKIVKDAKFDGITLLNTYTAVALDYKNMKFKLGNIYGGYSGPAIKPLVQRWVYDIRKKFEIDIIASGGVVYESDVVEYLLLGAKSVQIGSAYFRNPNLPVKCINFLKNYLEEKKLSLKQIIGLLK